MWFEPTTVFAALITTIVIGGVVLLWSWYEDRSELVLAWGGVGFLLAAAGAATIGAREDMPPSLSQTIGPALVMLGIGSTWAGARAFNGRSTSLGLVALGALVWVCLPAGFEDARIRAACAFAVISTYLMLGALEVLGGKPLRGRKPLGVLLLVHALASALRIPLSLGFVPPDVLPVHTKWFGLFFLEGMAFCQACAVLLISLTKERLEARLRQMADTDPLTGLCNRRAFFERGSAVLSACARLKKPAAVLIFDLDEFKEVNDTFGHAMGDEVLKAFSAAATGCVRAKDVVGRIGGEEFALVLPEQDQRTASAVAHQIMARFKDLAAQVEGHAITCTASGGLAFTPEGVGSIEALLGAADTALYAAKREGINVLRLAS